MPAAARARLVRARYKTIMSSRFYGEGMHPTVRCCAIGLAILGLGATDALAAGGAFVVDDAVIAAPGHCQVESWVSSADNGQFVAVSQPSCVAELGLPVELKASFQGRRADGEWTAVTGVQAKTVLIPVEPHKIGLGLVGGTAFDVTNGESTLTFINVPVTIELHDQLHINLNAGWAFDAVESEHHFIWGGSFEWEFATQFTAIAEIFGETGPRDAPRVQAGLRYQPVKNIDLDLIYGHNINGENANWITAGLTVRY